MFRLIRVVFLLMFAFVAGIFFERSNQAELCAQSNGQMTAGLCHAK
ncbi:MAG: hypothetical protein N4A53_09170 [Pelagimonas sp.]|jgi:hypothetical protein|nr:hypothetical protein [Pelagimonas sp.]